MIRADLHALDAIEAVLLAEFDKRQARRLESAPEHSAMAPLADVPDTVICHFCNGSGCRACNYWGEVVPGFDMERARAEFLADQPVRGAT